MGDDDVIIATIESQHLAPVTEKIHERTAQQHNDEESHHSPDSANSSPPSPTERKKTWAQRIEILGSLSAWYFFGIVAIVTSKILVQEWKCPPLVLTVQQMILGNTILRVVLSARSNVQPWPWESSQPLKSAEDRRGTEELLDKIRRFLPWLGNPTFVLVGVFNAFDFLCSNFAFSMSAAHFVETIKASDPITTATIAVLGKVDRLNVAEGGSLLILVVGVILSTLGNASEDTGGGSSTVEASHAKLMESVETASLVLLANVCFGLRALSQKRYRLSTNYQLDDTNLLFRMMQIGATFLLFPLCVLYSGLISQSLQQPTEIIASYLALAAVNSLSYVTYK